MKARRNEVQSSTEKQPSSGSNAGFFITATACTVFAACVAFREEINRNSSERVVMTKHRERTHEHEESPPEELEWELRELSEDIDEALGACNDPANVYRLGSLLCTRDVDTPMTIDRLRKLSENTSPSLRSCVRKILDRFEENPGLIPPTILIAKRKLSKLSAVDWRKHALSGPLTECELSVLGCTIPLPKAEK